ncbi:MAG TPA: FAD-dependent oxidoreductase [Salinimicrobium sp.]|nr:FAD-dependent oxidoreductase [Salinimicrobium sp.]
MFTKSLWNSFSSSTNFPTLKNDLEVDVAIIGGGITGISSAFLLSEKGLNVAVIEARKVGGGTTSHSTGNLYLTIDKILSALASKYDIETLKNVAESRAEAINFIEKNIKRFNLDCDFKRVPWYLFSENEENIQKIEDELNFGKKAGIPMESLTNNAFPVPFAKAVKLENQAYFNPMRYVQELANAISSKCAIYENTNVEKIEEKENMLKLHTTGGTVRAKFVLHATHTPKGIKLDYHTVLGPYREYGVAAKLNSDDYPQGIFWGFYGKGQKFSFRTYEREGEKRLIVVGEPHKVGQAENNTQHIKNLENYLKTHFKIEEITHRWGGQHYKPADFLPYIGKQHENSNIFLATGFSTDGLTYGTLSAMIIADTITGSKNKYAEFYEAKRHQPLKAAKEFVKENLNVAKELIKGYTVDGDDLEIAEVKPGEGRILSRDGKKMAVYKTEEGIVKVKSAVCPHMGCIVHWNDAETTWDCPCHGSRFEPTGDVLEGPAFTGLKNL